jgi:UDP-N-acetylglucosamine 1-carboxyvinyltransferase
MVLNVVNNIGIETEFKNNNLRVKPAHGLRPFRLQNLPYPGFPADLQAPFSVLATQADGMSLIQDPMYEGRLGHIPWLVKMGANAVVCDPHRVVISGPTPLHGYEIKALDIRAGATFIIAGLVAKGETIVNDAEILDRGYEQLAERLSALGADIRRE